MAEYTEIYADFIKGTRYETLTPQTIAQAKKSLLDMAGVSIAGYKLMEFPQWVVDYIAGIGGTSEASRKTRRRWKTFPASFT